MVMLYFSCACMVWSWSTLVRSPSIIIEVVSGNGLLSPMAFYLGKYPVCVCVGVCWREGYMPIQKT